MSEPIVWTYDWVPEGPRGFVRDIRLRWACEEAGLAYSVRTFPFNDRGPDHLTRQPFSQVPFLSDGELGIFESGAGLLHLARKREILMPRDPVGDAQTLQWTIAALNSHNPTEAAIPNASIPTLSDPPRDGESFIPLCP